MDRIYKVFVSSTFEDLREERAEVQKALLKLNCLPVGMELFPAADSETWEFIKSQILDADYYVVLIAGRYGSLAPDGVGFTEKEFDYAAEVKKPSIGFVHGDRRSIPVGKSEADPDRVRQLDLFIEKVRARPVRHFTTPHQLALEVTTSFVDLKTRRPAVGYVRADQTADFKKYAELLEENQTLSREMQRISSSYIVNSEDWFKKRIKLRINYFHRRDGNWVDHEASLGEIVNWAAPAVMANLEESYVFQQIAHSFLKKESGKELSEASDGQYSLDDDTEQRIRTRLSMIGIINVVSEARSQYSHASNRLEQYFPRIWKLTEAGRIYALSNMEAF